MMRTTQNLTQATRNVCVCRELTCQGIVQGRNGRCAAILKNVYGESCFTVLTYIPGEGTRYHNGFSWVEYSQAHHALRWLFNII